MMGPNLSASAADLAAPRLALMERLLTRLYALPGSEGLLVRGSFMLRHWVQPATRGCDDLDLLDATARPFEALTTLMEAVVDADPAFRDLTQTVIWAESPWPGLRFSLETEAGPLQVDISHGDPLAAEPMAVILPSWQRSDDGFRVMTIRPEIALAWKLHGLFEHLSGNWRAKDLRDSWLLLSHCELDAELLKTAIGLAFASREDPIELLQRLLYGDFGQSTRSRRGWDKFMADLPKAERLALPELLMALRARLGPLLALPDDGRLRDNRETLDYRLSLLRASGTPLAAAKLRSLSRRPRFLPYKAYPAIPHLPGSRTGPADRHLPLNKAALLIEKLYDPRDEVIVLEKLDGSCVGAIRLDGEIIAIGRDGDLAENSPNAGRRLWAEWVATQRERFLAVLAEGERLMGEWLALAHGTRYQLHHEPFVAFDLMRAAAERAPYDALCTKAALGGFVTPALLHRGGPLPIAAAVDKLGKGHHGSLDAPEGAIWRLERAGKVLLLAKYVRAEKIDGALLPENTGAAAVWNWLPQA